MRQRLSESNLNGGLPNVVVSGSCFPKTQTELYRRWIYIMVNSYADYFVPPQYQLGFVSGFTFFTILFLDLLILDFENRV